MTRGERWKYSFWRRRHERGTDIVKVHSSGRVGRISYKRGDSLYLFDYDFEKGARPVSSDTIRQLIPVARVVDADESELLLVELEEALQWH